MVNRTLQIDDGFDQIPDFLAESVKENIRYNSMVTKIKTGRDHKVKIRYISKINLNRSYANRS